ncbi:zinc-binding dehydrogenase [Streptomyces iranensis]|uniref:zinc-binding dehydrogenase n=1 Tax=Streptomyces iranensis TaxID=576784 RepID=UPI0039B78D02
MNLPEYGRGLVIEEYGKPMKLRDFPVTAPSAGGILVKIETATLCGSDVHLWEGAYERHGPRLPLMPGHEAVGTVVALGEAVEADSVGHALSIGDRVVWEHESCGQCYACNVLRRRTLCTNRRLGMLTSTDDSPHLNGTIAEYSYVWPGSGRLRVPDAVESTWASAASCAFRTVLHAIERLGQVDYRHDVVVQGSGALGLFATAMLSTLNPRKLIVIGAPAGRLEVASAFGADETISIEDCPDPAERVSAVLAATDGRGADVVCDFSGGPGVVGEGIEFAAPDGRLLIVGSTTQTSQAIDPTLIVVRNLTLFGSTSAEIGSYYRAMRFLERHRDRFDWDLLVGNARYSLDDAAIAFDRMKAFDEVKAVIEPHRNLSGTV